MEEYVPISREPENDDMALVIKGGSFAWDKVSDATFGGLIATFYK